MKTLAELKKRLRELEVQIAEARRRLPAHSVKPPLMMDLLALEDEYDAILKQIGQETDTAGLAGNMQRHPVKPEPNKAS